MEKMFKKTKKFMVVAAAAVMLSAGFATVAPNEAHAAHWADKQMNWAKKTGIITVDLRDSLTTRQDTWVMIARMELHSGVSLAQARNYVMNDGISDGTRGTDRITRIEAVAMMNKVAGYGRAKWDPAGTNWLGKEIGIYDGTRDNDYATRAEVVTMLYNAQHWQKK
ncbi:protein phosphatase 2C [Bacillus sp. COPE52]|uniref:protein phosphatase 2C n=1 Tax=Bacillus sp. COPE52 TaxID=2233998 RepID=UPI001ABF916C|nr:protein phosphatase 2C [Bacillus sp. COPE52]